MKKADVIRFFSPKGGHGSKIAVAKALGVTKQAITNWGPIIPEAVAYKVQTLSNGALLVDPAVYEKLKQTRDRKLRRARAAA